MYTSITGDELAARLKQKSEVVLDVREKEDFDNAHISGAVNIPIGELAATYEKLDDQQPIYVICYLGGRSQIAADFLNEKGYEVINIKDGMNNWQEETVSSVNN